MPADFEDRGTKPIYWHEGMSVASFVADACFDYEGFRFRSVSEAKLPAGEFGPIEVCLPEPGGPGLDVTAYVPGMVNGSLEQFEMEMALRRERGYTTNPDRLQNLSLAELKNRFSNTQYLPGTISNEKSLPSWAAQSVKDMVSRGIMDISSSKEFLTGKNITRGEFTAYVVRTFGFASSGKALDFTDVGTTYKYRNEIAAAYENGIIGGVSKTLFAPDALLTREQAATIIFRAMNSVLGEDTVNNSAKTPVSFKDAGSISSYARQAVNTMAAAGILTGYSDGTFGPGQNISMEQVAVILDRVIDSYILR